MMEEQKRLKINGFEFEGDINDLITICGKGNIELADLLDIDKPKKPKAWHVILCIIFFCVSCFFSWFFRDKQNCAMILFILDLVFLCSIVIQVHLIWKNYIVTIISVIFGMSIFLTCLGVLTPKEATKNIEQSIIKMK